MKEADKPKLKIHKKFIEQNQEFNTNGLVAPMNLHITLSPSIRQMELLQALNPNSCDKCGGEIIRKPTSDTSVITGELPTCAKCGNQNIPQIILGGGSAGGGKSYIGCYWVLISCIQFSNIKAVIARLTKTSLVESTWQTLKFVMENEVGLIEGIHFKENLKTGKVLLWNGSTISQAELELTPRDPKFQRLGSSEYTIAFVDEVGEISEKGIEVLYSRLRWRVAQTFKVPKLFLSTNPVDNWVRDRFVQDKEGNPVKCRRGDKYVKFSVFDNPKEEFRLQYASNLSNMRDEHEKLRLLYGDWDFATSSDTKFYSHFDGNVHTKHNLFETHYNPTLPLVISFDFNVIPQMSALMMQADYNKKELYIFKELSGTPKEKNNNTPAMTRDVVAKELKTMGHNLDILVTGDVTGNQRNAVSEHGVTNYNVIISEFKKASIKNCSVKLLSANPSQKTRGEFINDIFAGRTEWKVYVDLSCRQLTVDFMKQETNPDGSKNKHATTDPDSKVRYEKYGHFSDCFDYGVCLLLEKEWSLFKDGNMGVSYSPEAIVSRPSKPRFSF